MRTTPYGLARQRRQISKQQPDPRLFAWTVAIIILSALAIIAWTLPSYIFNNPQVPFNYSLLSKIKKLDPLRQFDMTANQRPARDSSKPWRPPRWDFLSATELFNKYSGYKAKDLQALNTLLKKSYVLNYKDERVPGAYATGSFVIKRVKLMEANDLFPGLALRAESKEFPNIVLEYLLPIKVLPNALCKAEDVLTVEKGASLAVVLNVQHLPNARLCVSVVPLNYQDRILEKGILLDLEVPERLNLHCSWPATGLD